MLNNPGFKAHLGEWRTIIMALHYAKEHLLVEALSIEDEEAQLTVYDHLERLDRLIPRIERELTEELDQTEASIDPALLLHAS